MDPVRTQKTAKSYLPDLHKTPPCPDQIWMATNIFSSFDVSTDTSLSDKTVFAHPALPWERTILRKSGILILVALCVFLCFNTTVGSYLFLVRTKFKRSLGYTRGAVRNQ